MPVILIKIMVAVMVVVLGRWGPAQSRASYHRWGIQPGWCLGRSLLSHLSQGTVDLVACREPDTRETERTLRTMSSYLS